LVLLTPFSCAKSARELCQEIASTALQLLEEPGFGLCPEAVGAAQRQAEQVRRGAYGLAGEVAEVDQFCGLRLDGSITCHCLKPSLHAAVRHAELDARRSVFCFGPLDLRAQAEVPSARRSDTPAQLALDDVTYAPKASP
jgi:hypothetical protein